MQDIDGLSVEDLKKLRARADALIKKKKVNALTRKIKKEDNA